MDANKPLVIAGPCSVESRQQLSDTLDQLARVDSLSMVRCGVWKPRTRPGGFEGLGEKALAWIAEEAQKHPTMQFACEVARPKHVALALQYGIKAVWVGARTTANPFMVQELAEAMRGCDLRVMVKNAPNPDVMLWMGAIERFRKAEATEVYAIHRGFDIRNNGGYRNAPLWEVPMELRRNMPEVPIICDPSHIAGRREPLMELAQTAMDLGFDGLMIEVHANPDQALTDAQQQITPMQLATLLGHLTLRQTDSTIADEQLRLMRNQIDQVDEQLLQLLANRLTVSSQIAQVKAQGNLAVFQPKRWEQVLQNRMNMAERMGVNAEFVKELFEKIHAESVRVQQEIIK